MDMSPKLLLVEGEQDQKFFEAFCRIAGLSNENEPWIGPANKLNSTLGFGKANTIHFLQDVLQNINDGKVTHFGMVVDADAPQTDGLGFVETWKKITSILAQSGYTIPKRPIKANGGMCFTHSDGLPNFGLWIMPDNLNNGFLEDFIKQSIIGTEKTLLTHANSTVEALAPKKFKSHHRSKAEVATWMAWQATPGQAMAGAVGAGLLNFRAGLAKQYIDWLKQIYL
jgi:hypothetical protein